MFGDISMDAELHMKTSLAMSDIDPAPSHCRLRDTLEVPGDGSTAEVVEVTLLDAGERVRWESHVSPEGWHSPSKARS